MDKSVVMAQEQPSRPTRTIGYMWFLTLSACVAWGLVSFDSSMLGIAMPLILKDFHMSVVTSGYMLTLSFIAGWIFTWLAGPLMDRRGRRFVLQFSLLSTAIFSGLTAFVSSVWQLFMVRILSTGTGSVEGSAAATIISEEVPEKSRGIMMAIQMAGYPLGGALAGTIGAVVITHGWRPLFLLAFVPALFVIWLRMFVKESDRFLDAKKVKEGLTDETKYRINVEAAKKSEWRQLFQPELRKQTWVLILASFFSDLGIIIMSFYAVYFVNAYRGFNLVEASSMSAIGMWLGIVGYVLIGKLTDHFASRNLMIVYLILGTAGVFLFTYVHGSFAVTTFFFALYQMFGMGIWGTFNRYTAESFPTRVRGTGVTAVFGTSWIGYFVGPTLASLLMTNVSPESAFLVVGIATFLTAICLLFGKKIPPKTTLEDIIH